MAEGSGSRVPSEMTWLGQLFQTSWYKPLLFYRHTPWQPVARAWQEEMASLVLMGSPATSDGIGPLAPFVTCWTDQGAVLMLNSKSQETPSTKGIEKPNPAMSSLFHKACHLHTLSSWRFCMCRISRWLFRGQFKILMESRWVICTLVKHSYQVQGNYSQEL